MGTSFSIRPNNCIIILLPEAIDFLHFFNTANFIPFNAMVKTPQSHLCYLSAIFVKIYNLKRMNIHLAFVDNDMEPKKKK